MDKNFEKYYLDSKADEFVLENIKASRSITDMLRTFVLERKHSIWTIFPKEVSPKNLLHFEEGYQNHRHPDKTVFANICSELIKTDEHYAWLLIDNERDSDLTPKENSINDMTIVFYYQKTVFHLLPKYLINDDNILITFKFGGWYPFIGFIAKTTEDLEDKMCTNSLKSFEIERLVENIKYIFLGAYDEEGYIIVEFD